MGFRKILNVASFYYAMSFLRVFTTRPFLDFKVYLPDFGNVLFIIVFSFFPSLSEDASYFQNYRKTYSKKRGHPDARPLRETQPAPLIHREK